MVGEVVVGAVVKVVGESVVVPELVAVEVVVHAANTKTAASKACSAGGDGMAAMGPDWARLQGRRDGLAPTRQFANARRCEAGRP